MMSCSILKYAKIYQKYATDLPRYITSKFQKCAIKISSTDTIPLYCTVVYRYGVPKCDIVEQFLFITIPIVGYSLGAPTGSYSVNINVSSSKYVLLSI